MRNTTLCYLEKEDSVLMLHRTKKNNDPNHNLWLGIGGGFEEGESAEDCLIREVLEETGLQLTSWKLRGIVCFTSTDYPTEQMFVFTSDSFQGTLKECPEGDLMWVERRKIPELELWEGDRKFLDLLWKDTGFFSMKLVYGTGNKLLSSQVRFYP